MIQEVTIQKSVLENQRLTDTAIKTIREVTKKSLDRWVESRLPLKVDSCVMNAMVANNLVDQEALPEGEGNLRKEVQALNENVGKDLDGVQQAFEELREKIKSLTRKIASGQCTCNENKRRRVELE